MEFRKKSNVPLFFTMGIGLFFVISTTSCTSHTPWHLDAISAGNEAFNMAKLKYVPDQGSSPLRFELVRGANGVEGFLTLSRHRFLPSTGTVEVFITTENTNIEESLFVLQGGMKLHLPHMMTQQIIEALQKGEKVDIIADDFEQTLQPMYFAKSYEKLTGSTIFLQSPIKGPLP
jgi:hypothetical protein